MPSHGGVPALVTDRRSGFTLIEVTIALGLLSILLLTVAMLIARGRMVVWQGRQELVALVSARTRLDELSALSFSTHALSAGGSVNVTDLVTNLSGSEPSIGGPGLGTGPDDALVVSHAGYVDHLDADGRWVSDATFLPPEAVFTRRWCVRRVGSGAAEAVLFEVLVAPTSVVRRTTPARLLQQPEAVRLVGARARRAS